ncbi:hypothetical protein BDY19DRAFT_1045526 [Irpex rosettiformis]|uniref:Uncharacterized protein n=1 Tax=Irpex rosettiformis TaxID=378272 RepID=A0ACB8UGI6_9APHY|nr:hypothetical protein BDY19DRAFT_1045526 [Irpex rosettiformis]
MLVKLLAMREENNVPIFSFQRLAGNPKWAGARMRGSKAGLALLRTTSARKGKFRAGLYASERREYSFSRNDQHLQFFIFNAYTNLTMAALPDYADRLSQLANTISSTAQSSNRAKSGPFTRAVLETPLGDLIRDVDSSEIGLFTLVSPGSSAAHSVTPTEDLTASGHAPQKAEMTRVALPIATPLRKPPPAIRRKDGGQRITEHDPEVYLNAAIKYLDRYQSIRPMPRFVEKAEALVDQVEAVRESIGRLNEKLEQLSDLSPEVVESPEARIKAEERRIAEFQAKIAQLKKQKETLLTKKRTGSRFGTRMTSQSRSKPPEPAPALPTIQPDAQEEDFWNTPGVPARTLHFTGDLLTDEQIDVSDMEPSMSSPLVHPPTFPRLARESRAMQFTVRESLAPVDISQGANQSPNDSAAGNESVSGDNEEGREEDEDVTVILKKNRSPRNDADDQQASSLEPESVSMVINSDETGESKTKMRFKITTELENIVTKIWSCMGDMIMPGNTFDKPPRAKETIAHLQALSAQNPSTDSPSVSSLSSLSTAQPGGGPPTAQQIHTARILLALLSAPPSYSMPLNALKEILNNGTAIGAGTRPIYACVAKRLLKIERGGGEQVVRFDL